MCVCLCWVQVEYGLTQDNSSVFPEGLINSFSLQTITHTHTHTHTTEGHDGESHNFMSPLTSTPRPPHTSPSLSHSLLSHTHDQQPTNLNSSFQPQSLTASRGGESSFPCPSILRCFHSSSRRWWNGYTGIVPCSNGHHSQQGCG